MPVSKCPNGKYRIGSGKCIYDSKSKAESAYKGYLAHKHMNEVKKIKEIILVEREWIKKTLKRVKLMK